MRALSLPPRNHYIPTDFTLRSAGNADASSNGAQAAALKEAAAALVRGMSGTAEEVGSLLPCRIFPYRSASTSS